MTNFNTGNGGYQGIQGLMSLLQSGLSQQQYSNLGNGMTGGNHTGAVGGAHGLFSGLSPWAVHFLGTQSGLFDKSSTMAQDPLTAPDTPQLDANGQPVLDANGQPVMNKGAGLTGSQLLMAQIHNSLAANAPQQYKLANGLTAADLQSMLGDYRQSLGNHPAMYAKGYNADGAVPQGTIASSTHTWDAPKGVYGYGKGGSEFHSERAAKAAGRFHKGSSSKSASHRTG